MVYDLLDMAVVCTEPDVRKFMLSDPLGGWDDEDSKHPFLVWVDEVYFQAGVTLSKWVAWQNYIQSQFVSLNFNVLPTDHRKHNSKTVLLTHVACVWSQTTLLKLCSTTLIRSTCFNLSCRVRLGKLKNRVMRSNI